MVAAKERKRNRKSWRIYFYSYVQLHKKKPIKQKKIFIWTEKVKKMMTSGLVVIVIIFKIEIEGENKLQLCSLKKNIINVILLATY